MFIPDTQACQVPNSSTPVSPAKILASQAFMKRVNDTINQANADFMQLANRPDLNAAGKQNSKQVLPFDNSFTPPSSVIRLDVSPTICVSSLAPNDVPTPRGCNIVTGKAAPYQEVTRLTLPPVGVATVPKTVYRAQPNPLLTMAQSRVQCNVVDLSRNMCKDDGGTPTPCNLIRECDSQTGMNHQEYALPNPSGNVDINVVGPDGTHYIGLSGFTDSVVDGSGFAVGAAIAGAAMAFLAYKYRSSWKRYL